MSILFIILTYLIASFINQNIKNKLTSSLVGIILFSSFLAFLTETLSLFYILNKSALLFSYGSTIIILIYLHRNKKVSLLDYLIEILNSIKINWKLLTITKKSILIVLSISLGLILLQGILYPPNNWDSMTYHLPRVIHWIQNQSVLNYPTNITRQIYSPPFSEYLITNSSILEGSDIFNNTIQWLYFIGLAVSVYLTLKLLNINRNILFYSIVLTLTLPEAILEASSTQNDIIHAFFLISTLYFCIKFIKETNYTNAIFLGLSAGLALLSKIIAYFYIPPLLFIFLFPVIVKYFKNRQLSLILKLVSIALIIILVNLNFTLRKLHFTHNISGTTKDIESGMTFEKYGVKLLFSTSVKNICLHADPYFVGSLGNQIAEKIHLIIHQDINEKGTNIFDYKFNVVQNWKNHEDSQPNFIHTVILFISVFIYIYLIIKRRIRFISFPTLILISTLFQFLFLNTIIRWEPWNTRIQIPLFAQSLIFSFLIFNELKKERLIVIFLNFVVLICLVYGLFIIIFNYTRPYLKNSEYTANIELNSNRYNKYFSNQTLATKEFAVLYYKLLKASKRTKVGYISHIDGWEYPISVVNLSNNLVTTEHIRVQNTSKKYKTIDNDIDYIYSSYLNQDTIKIGKQVYENQNQNNKYIFVYEKMTK